MPIYEYRCPACGGQFEALLRGDDPAPGCPTCGSAADRILSVTGGVRIGSAMKTGGPCCGESQMCDNPKRCCGQ